MLSRDSSQQKNYMAHIHIRWKAVIMAGVLVTLLIIIAYNSNNYGLSCYEDLKQFQSDSVSELHSYCNGPNIPVTGQEGELQYSDYHLESVHVAVRHGDRSPLHSLPNLSNRPFHCHFKQELQANFPVLSDYLKNMKQRGTRSESMLTYSGVDLYPNQDICDVGGLTSTGALQHIQLGLLFQERYLAKHRLLSINVKDLVNQVLVRGTKLNRTLQSAVALMYGMEPRIDMSTFPGLQCADNNTMCTADSGHQCQCDAVGPRYLDSFAASFGQTDPQLRSLPAAHRVSAQLHLHAPSELPRLSHVFDVAMTHFCHRMTPNCIGTSLARDIYGIINMAGHEAAKSMHYLHLSRLKSQPLLYEIAHRMNSSGNTYKFVLYSGHDSTVEPLTSAIGISDGTWPRYASRLVFELYSRQNKRFVRILFNGKDVTKLSKFCTGRLNPHELCPLEFFIGFVEEDQYNGSSGKTGYSRTCMNG